MEYRGIDVSTWQGDIDWDEVAKDNVEFAIMRATFGSRGIDAQFNNNIKNISTTNIHRGAYHYTYAKSITEAVNEAKHFLSIISPHEFNYPVAFDIEDSSLISLGKNTLTDISLAFCNTLKDAGYYVCIYSNPNWLYNYLDINRLKNFEIWLAQWSSKPTYNGDFGIWQYSSEGKVRGINGNVDMNISYKDYHNIIDSGSQNNGGTNNSGAVNPVPSTYTVVAGDTLWTIAEKFLGDGAKYKQIMAANNLTSDTIFAGQKLTISKPSSGSSSSSTYTVVAGDTLWTIAEKFLGDGAKYKQIMTANNLTSDKIFAGQKLIITKSSAGTSSLSSTYTVVAGDTLWTIAERFFGNGTEYKQIMAANKLSSDTITVGQKLIIPR